MCFVVKINSFSFDNNTIEFNRSTILLIGEVICKYESNFKSSCGLYTSFIYSS